jgi:hypothetical protein
MLPKITRVLNCLSVVLLTITAAYLIVVFAPVMSMAVKTWLCVCAASSGFTVCVTVNNATGKEDVERSLENEYIA